MNITFTEEDGTERTWEKFRPGRLMTTESEAIEKVTGMTYGEWGGALMKGGTLAGRALVWVLKKREEPTLRFRDVVYAVEALTIGLDEDEVGKLRDRLASDDSLTDEEREQVQAAISASEPERLDFHPEEADPVPPVPVPVDGSATG